MQGSTLKKAVVGSAVLSGFFYVQAGEVEAALGDQELKLGMNNSDVKELQDVLKEKGFFTYHTSTGYFGPITEKAVSDFQKAKGLPVTGTANADTLSALKGSAQKTAPASSAATLTIGERGQAVSDMQTKLKNKGYYNYTVDGIFGPITEKAVKQFQKAQGLSVTGVVDQATEHALNSSAPQTSKPSQATESTLKVGARGAEVSTVQQQLKNKGYYSYAVDGIFGPITEKAVKQFQSANGLSSTGVVDGKTKEKLSATSSTEVEEKKEEKSTGLTIGARSSAVTALQQGLKDRGYYNYKVDGIFGSVTEKAVKDFQSVVGLTVTGVADDATLDALKSRSGTTQTASVMKVGSKGKDVEKLQQDLKTAGTFHVGVTGYFGPVTEKAVKDFQKAQSLTVTGTATKETLDALQHISGPTVHPPVDEGSQDDVLKIGSKGELVVELQSKLKALGYYNSATDGAFGPITESAVKTFQSRNKLTPNGIVDSSTWEKLKQGTSYDGGGSGDNSGSFSVMDLIADASEYIGVPYTWGGNTPETGFDCAGFLVYVFKKQGVSLPRTMAQMWNVTTPVSSPSVGDIVYFETYKPGPSHGGIYIGNNKFIHSGSSNGVGISDMTSSYWAPRYLGAKRAH